MKFEHIPEKRIIPPEEAKKVTLRKYDWMLSLLKGQFDDIDPRKRPTALDFQGLRPDSKEEDFIRWIEKEMRIKKELILDDGKNEESMKTYFLLNKAYQRGKQFLKETLKYTDEETDIGPAYISTKENIFDLLKNTMFIHGQKGLGRQLLYCRKVKATLAAYDTLRNDAETLKDITTIFENSLLASHKSFGMGKSPLVLINEDKKGKNFFVASNKEIKGSLDSRGKRLEMAMLRFISRPEANAETALRDGIGMRFVIEKGKAMDLIAIICEWLVDEKKANFLRIENQTYLNDENIQKLKEYLSIALPENSFSIEEHLPDATSQGNFEALKVSGILPSGEEGKKFFTLAVHARQFEIQFVDPNNRNERGKMNHHIYDLVKIVTAGTRLDGGCSENAFLELVKQASNDSHMSKENILYYLLEAKNAPIVKIKKPNGNKGYYYAAHSVYSRWNEFGWVDPDLYEDIEAAKN